MNGNEMVIELSLLEVLLPNVTYFNISKVDIITLGNTEYMGILEICLSLIVHKHILTKH